MSARRKRIWGWYFFDWASQPYNTLLLTFVFGPYFAEVARGHYLALGFDAGAAAAHAQSFWGWGLTISSLIIAGLAPLIGAIADSTGRRMVWIWAFSACYVVGAWALWWVAPGGGADQLYWAVIFFGLGFIGMEFATIFTNSLMPSLAPHDELGEISGTGFAFGYLGGLVALMLVLLFVAESGDQGTTLLNRLPLFDLDPEAREGTRAVGPFTALWYGLFMIPFFLWVKEPVTARQDRFQLARALHELVRVLASLRQRKSLSAYLLASLFYRDGLNALYAFGGVYASGVLGWSIIRIGIFGIIGVVTAVIATWLGGRADRRWGPKPVIIASILLLIIVCAILVGLERDGLWGLALDPAGTAADNLFFLCGALIGAGGGVVQAASRTLMVRHTDADHATEAFGLYALSGKVASFIGPALIAAVTALTGSQRIGISPLVGLFILGLILLIWVNPRGEQTS